MFLKPGVEAQIFLKGSKLSRDKKSETPNFKRFHPQTSMGKLIKVLQNIFSNKLESGKNGKTLSNFPIEVSRRKCLKFGVSEFISLLDLLPLRKNCTSTPGFRNIGVKYWVLVLKTPRVARIMDLSVATSKIAFGANLFLMLFSSFYITSYSFQKITSLQYVISKWAYFWL